MHLEPLLNLFFGFFGATARIRQAWINAQLWTLHSFYVTKNFWSDEEIGRKMGALVRVTKGILHQWGNPTRNQSLFYSRRVWRGLCGRLDGVLRLKRRKGALEWIEKTAQGGPQSGTEVLIPTSAYTDVDAYNRFNNRSFRLGDWSMAKHKAEILDSLFRRIETVTVVDAVSLMRSLDSIPLDGFHYDFYESVAVFRAAVRNLCKI